MSSKIVEKRKARAIQRNIHLSPRKAKLVCDLVRNKKVSEARTILEFTNKKAAPIILKLLDSAIANATNNHGLQANKLYIYHIVANQAQTLKRTSPRAKGSADLIRKRHCHIEIIVTDDEKLREKELNEIKALKAKRAANNKGYSAKQRSGKLDEQKKSNKKNNVSVKKPVEKKENNQPQPAPRQVDAETLKRENESLKVVQNKVTDKKEETSIIMISTSPKHADILLDNKNKNVLFYKVTPINKVKRVLVCATAPVQAVVGEFDLMEIRVLDKEPAWKSFGNKSVLTKEEFDEYYKDSANKKAHAIVASKTFRYSKPKKLESFDISKCPSGFQYLK